MRSIVVLMATLGLLLAAAPVVGASGFPASCEGVTPDASPTGYGTCAAQCSFNFLEVNVFDVVFDGHPANVPPTAPHCATGFPSQCEGVSALGATKDYGTCVAQCSFNFLEANVFDVVFDGHPANVPPTAPHCLA